MSDNADDLPYHHLGLDRSGRPGPILAQQLATCTTQLAELLQGMGAVIRGVTNLTLIVRHELLGSGTRASRACSTAPPVPQSSPAPFAVITRTVCTLLAAALPSLNSLTLTGCCRDPALPAFGASCPRLGTLHVEAISVPFTALQDIGQHLPRLRWFTLESPMLCPTSIQLSEYVDAAIYALRASTSLKIMELRLDKGELLECKPEKWQHVPKQLKEFASDCPIRGIQHASALLSLLEFLSLKHDSTLSVCKILQQAPHLEQLCIRSGQWVVWCDQEETMPGIPLLKQRLLAGLQLEVKHLHLVGSSSSVQAVLAALPALPLARICALQFGDDPPLHCLRDVSRVFPRLDTIILLTHAPVLDTAALGIKLLTPLAACTSLQRLHINIRLPLTTVGLLELCQNMTGLRELVYESCEGVDLSEVRSAVNALGRVIEVQEFSV